MNHDTFRHTRAVKQFPSPSFSKKYAISSESGVSSVEVSILVALLLLLALLAVTGYSFRVNELLTVPLVDCGETRCDTRVSGAGYQYGVGGDSNSNSNSNGAGSNGTGTNGTR